MSLQRSCDLVKGFIELSWKLSVISVNPEGGVNGNKTQKSSPGVTRHRRGAAGIRAADRAEKTHSCSDRNTTSHGNGVILGTWSQLDWRKKILEINVRESVEIERYSQSRLLA